MNKQNQQQTTPAENMTHEPITKSKKRRMKKLAKQAEQAAAPQSQKPESMKGLSSGYKSVTLETLKHLPRAIQIEEIKKRDARRKQLLETYSKFNEGQVQLVEDMHETVKDGLIRKHTERL